MNNSEDYNIVKKNLSEVRERIERTAREMGRDPASIRIVGVCKKQLPERIRAAVDLGLTDLGHNYVQDLREQKDSLGTTFQKVQWHFVGQLQSNKVKALLRLFPNEPPLIHSLDRLSLARALNAAFEELALKQPVPCLIQVIPESLSQHQQRGGCRGDQVMALLKEMVNLPHIRVLGLMVIPDPAGDAAGVYREIYNLGQVLHRESSALSCERFSFSEYSMGMTGDFETAILAGATLVRIGTGIFGTRRR